MKALATLRATWSGLAVRERRLVAVALPVVLAGLLWSLGVAPALQVLRSAPPRLQQLDAQLQAMRGMAAQARALQGRPVMRRADAVRALDYSMRQRLGTAGQLIVAGDRATITLSGVAPAALAQWLLQARETARVAVQQARLTRSADGWNGSIVLQLPPE